jgi:SpoVK/Ycf46/Vps4 family AAA+-type ATPase
MEKMWLTPPAPPKLAGMLTDLCQQLRAAAGGSADARKNVPPGLLLHGESGERRKAIALAIGQETGLPVVETNVAEVLSGWETEKRVTALFARAKDKAPAILLINDLDKFAPSLRAPNRTQDHALLITALLGGLSSLSKEPRLIFPIGTAEHTNQIDPAVIWRFPSADVSK